MRLSVMDRLMLLDVLPQQGNILTLRIVRDAQQALELHTSEIEDWEITLNGPHIRWNQEKVQDVDVSLSEAALGIAREAIKKLDGENKLTANHISLWEKLIDGGSSA
jgi:hypothetical protein